MLFGKYQVCFQCRRVRHWYLPILPAPNTKLTIRPKGRLFQRYIPQVFVGNRAASPGISGHFFSKNDTVFRHIQLTHNSLVHTDWRLHRGLLQYLRIFPVDFNTFLQKLVNFPESIAMVRRKYDSCHIPSSSPSAGRNRHPLVESSANAQITGIQIGGCFKINICQFLLILPRARPCYVRYLPPCS